MSDGENAAAPGNLDLALIGNCRLAALLDNAGRMVWLCFPRFDADPVFSRLLSGTQEKGFCDVLMADLVHTSADYVRNTAILETVLEDKHGGRLKITDYAPRFSQYERIFRPPVLIRRISPLSGSPRIAIRVRPTHGYGKICGTHTMGSNHIRYLGGETILRLTTDAPLSYIVEETVFRLSQDLTLVFGPDEPFQGALSPTGHEFEDKTRRWWQHWVRSLAVPLEWQSAVTRAAIALKLCSFEETGAIVAALTTSIPESQGSGRNWDYRFCWLRDAHFVVQALNRLGTTDTMESYINYIATVAGSHAAMLRPVHAIVPGEPLDERVAPDLDGFLGDGPVRVGNEAARQDQHDVYGSVILATTQMFLDERLPRMGDATLFHRLERLGTLALKYALEPDAGIWEYRGAPQLHTHSATLCWAACDRLARIARIVDLPKRREYWREQADKLRDTILKRAWNDKLGALAGTLDGDSLDASVLLVGELGLLDPCDERFIRTVETIGRDLSRGGRIMRYTTEDDFGLPHSAFLVCNFWYINALAAIGRRDEARALFDELIGKRNAFGLLSEDINPATGELWGNLPQTYSMAAIVDTAERLSRPWEDAWRRD